MRFKIKTGVGIALTALVIFSPLAEAQVSGVGSINNSEKFIDYKDNNFESFYEKFGVSSRWKERLPETRERSLDRLSIVRGGEDSGLFGDDRFSQLVTEVSDSQLSWLVRNNIVSRDSRVEVGRDGVFVENPGPLLDRSNLNEGLDKTEFLMMLYKSVFGVIESRPVVFNVPSVRDSERIYYEWDEDEERDVKKYESKRIQVVSGEDYSFRYTPYGEDGEVERRFEEGDYLVFVTPNVPELYLSDLLKRNIITTNDIGDVNFLSSYRRSGDRVSGKFETPSWSNELEEYFVGRPNDTDYVEEIDGTSVLGNSYNLLEGTTSVIEKIDSSFFREEEIDSMEALRFVEKILRIEEKDMTDTESKIITYKYGANYISHLSEEDKRTVMFLTSKGILNFEDETEYRNLYGRLTKNFAYKIAYRVANKNARLNFSEIQLTDNDNFWINRGFSEIKMDINVADPVALNELVGDDGNFVMSPFPDVMTLDVVEQNMVSSKEFEVRVLTDGEEELASGIKVYRVTQQYDFPEKYRYKGIPLTDTERLRGLEEEIDIVTGENGVLLTFSVEASNPAMAVTIVNSNIQTGTLGFFEKRNLNGVIRYTEDGKEVVLIPQSSFNSLGTEIQVLEDKVLRNVNTGAMAILLEDSDIALVGTHVIHSEDLMVKDIEGEVYYNLDIIKTLMSNVYMTNIDSSSLYIINAEEWKGKVPGVLSEEQIPVLSSTGNKIGDALLARVNMRYGGDEEDSLVIPRSFINISQLSSISNYVVREYPVRNEFNEKVSFKIIMDFNFKLPDRDMNFTNPLYDSENPSVREVNDFLFTKPNDPELRDWWENNIELSNAFLNVMYETSGYKYVKSGWYVPNITILYDVQDSIQREQLAEFFIRVGNQLSFEWVDKFIGDRTGYNRIVKEPGMERGDYVWDENNGDGIFYPRKELPVDMFPKWVHAMFNNGGVSGNDEKNNSVLWRDLMVGRTLSYEPSRYYVDGVSMYYTSTGVYGVSGYGMIYKMLIDGDLNAYLKGSNSSLVFNTRTQGIYEEYWKNRRVRLGEESFHVEKIDGNKIVLVDEREVEGLPVQGGSKGVDLNGYYYVEGGEKEESFESVRRRYDFLRNLFINDSRITSGSDYSNSVRTYEEEDRVVGEIPSGRRVDSMYLVDSSDKPFIDFSANQYYGIEEMEATLSRAHVRLEVDLNYWRIDDDGALEPRRTFPFLQVGSIYSGNVNQMIVDTILADHLDYVPVPSLENGEVLRIGDMLFVKRGEYFVSYPQENIVSWTNLITNALDPKIVSEEIVKNFIGIGIPLDEKVIPLSSFILDSRLGYFIEGMDYDGTLVGDNTSNKIARIYTGNESSNYGNEVVKSVSFSVKFSDDLLARPTSNERTYELVLNTTKMGQGYLEDIPFFSESLSLRYGESGYLDLNKTDFVPIGSSDQIKEGFMEQHERNFREDVVSFLKTAFISLMSFLIVMSWLCYMVVNYRIGYGLFDIIKNPDPGSDRKGIDVIKVVSLGFFSLENKVPVFRVIASNLLMFVLIYIVTIL